MTAQTMLGSMQKIKWDRTILKRNIFIFVLSNYCNGNIHSEMITNLHVDKELDHLPIT